MATILDRFPGNGGLEEQGCFCFLLDQDASPDSGWPESHFLGQKAKVMTTGDF